MAGGKVEHAIRALEYIKNNPDANHTARAVAEAIGVKDITLLTSVKKHLGLGWPEFVSRIKEGDAPILMAHLQTALKEREERRRRRGTKEKKEKGAKRKEKEAEEDEEVLQEERIIRAAMAKERKKDLEQIGAMEYNAAFALGGELIAEYGKVASAMGLDVREYIHRAVKFYETYKDIVLDLEEELKVAYATIEAMKERISLQAYFDNLLDQLVASKLAGVLDMSISEICAFAYAMAVERDKYLRKAMAEIGRDNDAEGGYTRVGGNESEDSKDGAGYGVEQGRGHPPTPAITAPARGADRGPTGGAGYE